MKRILLPLAIFILLAPALMGATPTPTPEPTKVTMPEGWASIAETREIGGRQVVLNEKGDAATEIDGEWYPVDAKGCYYEEFLSPEVQNGPKVVEVYSKLIGEKSFSKLDANGLQRYKGSTPVGIIGGQYPAIYDRRFDSQLIDQYLCYQSGKWYHITDQVMAIDRGLAPTDATLFRAVVGWFDGDKYMTFTYLEKTNERAKNSLDLTNANSVKANNVDEAFSQWRKVIGADKQVEIRLPSGIWETENGTSDSAYANLVSQLVSAAHNTVTKYWTSSIEDDVFEEWAKSEGNQEKYFSDATRLNDLFIVNKKAIWSTWMSRAAKGEMPIPHIRTITTEK